MDLVKGYDWACFPKDMPPLGSPVTTSTMRFQHDLGAATKGPDDNIRASQLVRPKFFVAKAAVERKRKDMDDDDDDDDAVVDPKQKAKRARLSLGELFGGMNNNKWKCQKCYVQSDNGVYKCVSCESIRPGYETKPMEEEEKEAKEGKTSSASIGSSGFTFAGPTTNSTANNDGTLLAAPTSGFAFSAAPFGGSATTEATTFGIPFGAAPAAAATGSTTTGGFVFGAPATDSSAPATTPTNSVFSLGAASGTAGAGISIEAASSAPAADQKDSEASSPKKPAPDQEDGDDGREANTNIDDDDKPPKE